MFHLTTATAIELLAGCAGSIAYLYWAFANKSAEIDVPDAAVKSIPQDIAEERRQARIEADYAPKHFRKS